MQLPPPVGLIGVTGRVVFGELREILIILSDALGRVRQRCTRESIFLDELEDTVAHVPSPLWNWRQDHTGSLRYVAPFRNELTSIPSSGWGA